MKSRHQILALVAATAVLLAVAQPARAGTRFEDSSTGRQIALGTGSGLVSIVYSPIKFLYAAGATVTGGLILAFTGGDSKDTAARVVRRGTTGDWWVHPDVFTGHRQLHFNGPDQ